MTETDRVIDKINKLRAHQASAAKVGSMAEAEAFADMINRLLLKHELTEVDLNVTQREDDPIIQVYTTPADYGMKHVANRVAWQEALARIVAKEHLCRFMVLSGSSRLVFVGTKVNAETAEYAFGVLAGAADRMSLADRTKWVNEQRRAGTYGGSTAGFRDSWLSAFITRISEKFDAARKAAVEETGNASTALVRLDQSLERVNDYMRAISTRKAPARSMGTGANSDGYARGRAAADRMNVGQRGIKGGTGTAARGLLK
jgi:hypothetical protein